MKPTVQIGLRYPEAGFVYCNDKRMVFAPLHVMKEDFKDPIAIGLQTGNWGHLSDKERNACKKELEKFYNNEREVIFVD